jgi:NitT/TauT family transport system ATP-binding protein
MADALELTGLYKTFQPAGRDTKIFHALKGIDLRIGNAEILSIVGTTGSGKTTLLNILSGIEKPDKGEVKVSPASKIGYVFQSNAVFPWRTVEQNLGYALEMQGLSKADRHERVIGLCRLIGFDPDVFAGKYPKALSGGENRRLALGMTLAYEANVLLLDEPTGQLDHFTAYAIQDMILRLWQQFPFTIVLVTHNIEEAIYLSSRVVVLRAGTIRKEFNVPFPYPRNTELRNSMAFQTLKTDILSNFQEYDPYQI